MAGVSPAAITKACKGELAPACRADRVDAEHEAARAYLARKGKTDGAPTSPPKPARPAPADPTPSKKPGKSPRSKLTAPGPKTRRKVTAETVDELERDLAPFVEKWGTVRDVRDQLLAIKDIQTIRGKRLQNDETEGRLVSWDLVTTSLLGLIDATFRRLLGDAAKTISREMYAMRKAELPVEDAERKAREILSSHLAALKANAARLLRGGEEATRGV